MTRDPELTRLLGMELERHLVELEALAGKGDAEAHESMRRSLHALKGSAGLAGEPALASAMQRLERRIREGDQAAMSEIVPTIRRAIRHLSSGLGALTTAWPKPPHDLGPSTIEPSLRVHYVAEVTDRLAQIDAALFSATEPLDAVGTVYRSLHTIKGAASAAGDEAMAWFCHGLEERLRGASESSDTALMALQEVAKFRAMLGALLDESEVALATLRGLPGRSRAPQRPSAGWMDDEMRGSEGDVTIRVPAQSVDRLLDHMGAIAVARERVAARITRTTTLARTLRASRSELLDALRLIGPPKPWGVSAAALSHIERAVQTAAVVGDDLDRASEQLELSDQAFKESAWHAKKILSAMRQTPIRGMFNRLSTAALAEARRTGCLLTVRSIGGEETIDRRIAEHLIEPCLQLTRNAVAHGIETPEVREKLNKPREATITFTARKLASRLVVTISDDGSGVDIAAVRSRAIRAGVVTDVLAEAADDQTLLELLFLPGFSTREQSPDLLAGRGIGLDITLAAVQKLGGSIRLSSRPHSGFDARVDVPIDSGLATVLWVTAGGVEHALPAIHTRAVRLNDGLGAERVPHLAACLEPANFGRAAYVLDIDVGLDAPSMIELGVDGVGQTEEVLVRELSPLLRGIGPFAGAIVRGDGLLRLALDVHALAPRARALGRVPEGRISELPPSRPPPQMFDGHGVD